MTEASKYVLVLFGILVTSASATGLWLVSVPSAGGVAHIQLLLFSSNLPVQPSKRPRSLSTRSECVFSSVLRTASGPTGRRLRSQVFIADRHVDIREPHIPTDLVTFVCIVVFVFKLKADHGQSRMTRLMRTILQDGILYFFVMVGFHIAMALFTVFSRVIEIIPRSSNDAF